MPRSNCPPLVLEMYAGKISEDEARVKFYELEGRAIAGDQSAINEFIDLATWAGKDMVAMVKKELERRKGEE